MRDYYALWYRLATADSYLIWYSNDTDGVVVNADGFVPSFRSITALEAFAATLDIELDVETPVIHNLDVLKRWLGEPKNSTVDCVVFLGAWNLFVDVARSTHANAASIFLKREEDGFDLYDKLFWGNNLPAMTPEGHTYIPLWPNDQIARMQEILAVGLHMFEENILAYR
jgi:hypothetical protein